MFPRVATIIAAMFAQAYGAAIAIIVGSVLVGRAVCALCGGPRRWGAAPLVGLSALLVLADAAIKLPGKAQTASVACIGAVLASVAFLVWNATRTPTRDAAPIPPRGFRYTLPGRVFRSVLWGDVVVTGVSLAGASIPFLANGRVGPGAGIDNDMAIHLLVAEALRSSRMAAIWNVLSGYPTGPHAVVAVVGTSADLPLDMVFTGLLLAVVALTAMAAADLLASEALWRRAIIGALCSLAYLVAAFYGEAAFKETIMAGLLLAFVLHLEQVSGEWAGATRPRRFGMTLPAGLLVAGAIYTYSYLGVAWMGATLAVWVVAEAVLKPALVRGWMSPRRLTSVLPWVAGFVALGVLALIPIAGDLRRFFKTVGVSPAGSGAVATGNLGNLFHPLSAAESLGVWWSGDFRLAPESVVHPGVLSAFALAALVFGFVWSVRRRGLVLPAAVVGSALIYLYSDRTQSPYVAAKALVIASPIVMALALRGLLSRPRAGPVVTALILGCAGLFCAAAAASSVTSLRFALLQAPEAARELGAFHHLTGDKPVLFLGIDDWAPWQLRASPVATLSNPTPTVGGAVIAPNKPFASAALDFDSVTAASLDNFEYVITTNNSFASQPPANFHLVARRRLYQLWRRSGPTPQFESIDTPGVPGAVLNCHVAVLRQVSQSPGVASIMATPLTFPGINLAPGGSGVVRLALPAGQWQLSAGYTSTVTTDFAAQGRRYSLPGYLGRPGSYFDIGPVTGKGVAYTVSLHIHAARPSFLTGDHPYMNITTIAATRIPDARQLVPLRQACGKYVDWFRLK